MDIGKGLMLLEQDLAVMAGMMTGIGQGLGQQQAQLRLWDVTRKQRARLDQC